MLKLPATFWSGVVTFIVTLFINTGISYYSGDQGLATIGRPIMLDGKVVLPLALENFSGKSISGLLLQVPEEVGAASVVRDAPVQITSVSDQAGNLTRSIRIDGIEPKTRTNLFVVLRDVTEVPLVRIINADEVGFMFADGVPESKLHRAVTYGLVVAGIYTVIAVALGYYFNKIIQSLHKRLDEAKENSTRLHENSDKLRKELDDLKMMQSKIRILLLSRISDYSKELEFWRNAIKELLVRRGAPASTSDELIKCVTRALKTFGTRRGSDDFDAIVFAAGVLKDAENKARSVEEADR
ncbi:aminotransferase class I/II-fold pyridoxal phosphate-dependent enzyme [Paraburkholderia elongata]|uniref:Aminotransferase class I/II-fold pyridoxal phosphate-dependent enzyme n=1 Tax=Paraburkholderia elongata TaxID=2675747 RepID=A0A972SMS6_9BURK|nr:aminotransferase class I/II-fold pyridoxal phosphate-dependent enzyme [Paraburkholderia elongata]NPT60492.1 aminotransferase class I/II-fold pyridoxal phosphate-dependent enzyme [Paraburkholderia elongata]